MEVFNYAFFLILMIGPLVFFHELGHFIFAKLFGVKVLTFSLGFGPAIPGLRRRWGETEYQVASVPLGGYVKMLGEDPDEEVSPEDEARAFNHVRLWKRMIIVSAGPAFNVLLAMMIFFVAALISGDKAFPAQVGSVMPNTPAARAGLRPGDRIVEVGDQEIHYWRDMRAVVEKRPGQATRFVVVRGGKRLVLRITPDTYRHLTLLHVVEQKGLVGISLAEQAAQVGVAGRAGIAGRAGLHSGDLVVRVGATPVRTWRELQNALERAGGAPIQLFVLRQTLPVAGFVDLRELVPSSVWLRPGPGAREQSGWRAYGLERADAYVDRVEPDTPAAKIGLAPGDRVLSLDGRPVESWFLLEQRLQEHPEAKHQLVWRTPDGTRREGTFRQKTVVEQDEFKQEVTHHVFGATNRQAYFMPDPVKLPAGRRLSYAAWDSLKQTGSLFRIMVVGIAQMIRGNVPTSSIGGPIMLAHVARTAARKGWEMFVFMLALISINLALLNLLPIPILDGGHILVFTVEAIRRKPLSINARATMNLVGLALIAILMVLAFKNDCVRYILN